MRSLAMLLCLLAASSCLGKPNAFDHPLLICEPLKTSEGSVLLCQPVRLKE